MPVRMMIGLGPGKIVLDVDPAPPQEAQPSPRPPPNFGPCILWPNGWMAEDATWYEGMPRSRPHCDTWGPSCPSKKGHSPQFLAHVYCGQTVAHLSYCCALVETCDRTDIQNTLCNAVGIQTIFVKGNTIKPCNSKVLVPLYTGMAVDL